MTRSEFRAAVFASGRDFASIAAGTGLSVRAMRAYWHGERPVPDDVAEFLTTGVHPGRADRPPVGSEPPNYAEVRHLRREVQMTRNELSTVLSAVYAMCLACEPDEKACRDAKCPLRDVSPFPMHAKPFGKPLAIGGTDPGTPSAEWPPRSTGSSHVYGSLLRSSTASAPSSPVGGGWEG